MSEIKVISDISDQPEIYLRADILSIPVGREPICRMSPTDFQGADCAESGHAPDDQSPQLSRRWRMIAIPVAWRTFDRIPSIIRIALQAEFHIDPAAPGECTVLLSIQKGFYRFINEPISEITDSSKQYQGLHYQ